MFGVDLAPVWKAQLLILLLVAAGESCSAELVCS